MRDSERIDCQSWREHISACESSLLLCWCTLYLQHSLQLRADGFFVLFEGVGVDIQRGGELAVAEDGYTVNASTAFW